MIAASFFWTVAWAHAAQEVVGTGTAPMVQGDEVTARAQALRAAFAAAVESGVVGVLSADVRSQHAAHLDQDIYAQARGYIARYRVLEERRLADWFQVEIAAVLAWEPLMAQLRLMVGDNLQAPLGLTRTAVDPPVAVLLHEITPATPEVAEIVHTAVTTACAQAGLRARFLSAAAMAAGAEGLTALRLDLAASLSAADGVRGLDLTGARADLQIRIGDKERQSEVSFSDVGWGAAATADQAYRDAVADGLRDAMRLLQQARHVTAVAAHPSAPLLRLSGLETADQWAAVCALVTGELRAATHCVPQRFRAADIWLETQTPPTLERLAEALTQRDWGRFYLQTASLRDGLLHVQLVR